MKWLILLLILPAHADELRTFSNGMTCQQDADGHIYGCSGGRPSRRGIVTDVESGAMIRQIRPGRAIDAETGQIIITPNRRAMDQDQYRDED